MKLLFFTSSLDWRNWLKINHQRYCELWVGFYKKSSGKPSLTYPVAVDEALCFGWIDGVRKSVAADSYTVRFTPRKPQSRWSAVNITRAQQLAEAGRMRPSGLATFSDAATQPPAYSYEQRRRARFSAEDERRFRANPAAWAFFQAQPPWYRRTATFWVVSAKKEETRRKRLATLISDSQRGKSIKPLARSPISKRQKKVR